MLSHNEVLISLFDAVEVNRNTVEGKHEASTIDVMAAALDFGYTFTPDTFKAIEALTPRQRGTFLKNLGADLSKISGYAVARNFSPLYRAFPNHTILPLNYRLMGYLLYCLGLEKYVQHDPMFYGADPITGFQNKRFGADHDYDSIFIIALDKGRVRRNVRFLKLATHEFIQRKFGAMMQNLVPFSGTEILFIEKFAHRIDLSALSDIRFREKLPFIASFVTMDEYTKVCNSVTDALRLAAHWSDGDVSLKNNFRFQLSTENAKCVLGLIECILTRKNTDYETDFNRHPEKWKRFFAHVRVNKYEKRFPNTVTAAMNLRHGYMRSWESRYATADTLTKISMAGERPGVLVRRLVALAREAEDTGDTDIGRHLINTLRDAMHKVDALKLLQAFVHLSRTVKHEKRVHSLPDGSLMTSWHMPENYDVIASEISAHLSERLGGTLPYGNSKEAFNLFIPSGNRDMSDSSQRTARGDRVTLSYTDNDVVRLFLFWHESCDVDISAVFFNKDMEKVNECTYYNLKIPYAIHSGDILDGSEGAAEFIDISIGRAKAAGVRYVLMNANVYSGVPFDQFECCAGVMLRDGQTGEHFEASTVETKLNISSATTNRIPVIFDLDTGQMIYVDLPQYWDYGTNVHTNKASLAETLRYFVDFADYRPTFGDVLAFAGTLGNVPATAENLRENIDEILETLSSA